LASSIPLDELIFTKCDFFLDTDFLGFYTFVNCKVSLAGSMSTRQRENRKNGNQESSSKEASEEGSQENSKEEVSKQRNRQHNRGTPKASPEVFLANAISPVFMRLRRTVRRLGAEPGDGLPILDHMPGQQFFQPDHWRLGGRQPGVCGCGVDPLWAVRRVLLPKWYSTMTPLVEAEL
jgi:hypothetical protein